MRLAITVGREHGSNTWRLVHGPNVPIQEQLTEMKEHQGDFSHPMFAEMQLWQGDTGIWKKARFERSGPPELCAGEIYLPLPKPSAAPTPVVPAKDPPPGERYQPPPYAPPVEQKRDQRQVQAKRRRFFKR